MIDRNCSARGADAVSAQALPKPPHQTPNPRVAPMGPQGPPVPYASLRTDRAALRGRVPPMDYRDNPSCAPKMIPPPNRRGSAPRALQKQALSKALVA